MQLTTQALLVLLSIVLPHIAHASDSQESVILTGTFEISQDRQIVVQPPDVAPSLLPVPVDGNGDLIPVTKESRKSRIDQQKLKMGLLIGFLSPLGVLIIVATVMGIKTLHLRRNKHMPRFPSWSIILKPSGKWPEEQTDVDTSSSESSTPPPQTSSPNLVVAEPATPLPPSSEPMAQMMVSTASPPRPMSMSETPASLQQYTAPAPDSPQRAISPLSQHSVMSGAYQPPTARSIHSQAPSGPPVSAHSPIPNLPELASSSDPAATTIYHRTLSSGYLPYVIQQSDHQTSCWSTPPQSRPPQMPAQVHSTSEGSGHPLAPDRVPTPWPTHYTGASETYADHYDYESYKDNDKSQSKRCSSNDGRCPRTE